jgi:hypothetical protein
MDNDKLFEACKTILKDNNRGTHTVPAGDLYPHQWLWDSCFIAIGQRHYDIERAQKEILSLIRGQWSNGMIPNMILANESVYSQASTFWRSSVSPLSPDNVSTSGITQPPILAEAVVRIGEKLQKTERHTWYQRVYPALLAYHTWLYKERDPHNEGLVLQIHPWETGLDNTPPWISELHEHKMPLWIRIIEKLRLDSIITLARKDTVLSLPGERLSTIDGLCYYSIQRRLRRKRYDIQLILKHADLSIEDVSFNAIFIRANQHLKTIAKSIRKTIPEDLQKSIKKTEEAYEQLWDAYTGEYFSRNFTTHKLIKVPSIGTLIPLYAGHITKERAHHLVKMLKDNKLYNAKFPVPTVPLNSPWFNHHAYWQGPVWINTNWLIIDGLKRYGYEKEAKELTQKTIELVKSSGPNEYFSPKDGSPAGAKNFSWTASLIIDLLKSIN